MHPSAITSMTEARQRQLNSDQSERCWYAAQPSYFHDATWIQIPQSPNGDFLSALYDNRHRNLHVSSIVGVVKHDNLFVDPHGDCADPAMLAGAQLRFSISRPGTSIIKEYGSDYDIGRQNIGRIYHSLSDGYIDNHVLNMDGSITFIHPMFLRYGIGEGKNCRPRIVLPFPIHEDYRAAWLGAFDVGPECALGRAGYHMIDPFKTALMNLPNKFAMQRMRVRHGSDTRIKPELVRNYMEGALVEVQYYLMGGKGYGFWAHVKEVTVIVRPQEL